MFVFPVVHPFPLVVSQYLNRVQLNVNPSQNRTCAVNASGSPPSPDLTATRVSRRIANPFEQPACCRTTLRRSGRVSVVTAKLRASQKARGSATECSRHSVCFALWPDRLPCTRITGLHFTRLVFELQRYCAVIRLPERHLPFLLLQLVRAYSWRRDWTSRRTRTTGISLVASLA